MLDDFGFRQYDPWVGRFWGVDPLAAEMPAWSSYSYTFNNPIRFIDPDGRAPQSPIFGKDGKFLGTDSEGFKGEIVIMNEKNYNTWTNGGKRILDHSVTEAIIKANNPIFGQSLDNYVATAEFNPQAPKDFELLSNIFTNLLDAAGKAGLIEYSTDNLTGGKISVGYGGGTDAANYTQVGDKDRITATINPMSLSELASGAFSGTQSLFFLGNSGDAINVLGVHEPMHRQYPGNTNHSIIDPAVMNASTNKAAHLMSVEYRAHITKRMNR